MLITLNSIKSSERNSLTQSWCHEMTDQVLWCCVMARTAQDLWGKSHPHTDLWGVWRHDSLDREWTSRHRVSIIANVHHVRALLLGDVHHRVYLIGWARFQFARHLMLWWRGDVYIKFSLTSSTTGADRELLIFANIDPFRRNTNMNWVLGWFLKYFITLKKKNGKKMYFSLIKLWHTLEGMKHSALTAI